MSEHTKGELRYLEGSHGLYAGSRSVCTVTGARNRPDPEREANARRLVACWNAFDGISTEDIEAATPVKGLITRYNAALRRRDRLLEALNASRFEMWRLLDAKGIDPQAIRSWPEIVQIDAAIAAVNRGES